MPARGSGDLRGSIATRKGASLARRFFVFLGPGYLVATGYMDPGNWATALAAGSRYGCALLFAAVLSSLIAIVLQALSARLGLASGLDLAQACRARFSKPAAIALWLVAEAAIAATDLAEIIGTAIGLQLLFGMPLAVGIAITLLDTFVVLAFERAGFRKIELFVVSLLGLIAFSFTAQLAMAHVDLSQVARGLVPTRQLLDDPRMLYLGLGIVGATVMPHNLFLHSSIVLTRAVGASPAEKREAIGFALIDSAVALFFALLVNGAILVLAASVFYTSGHVEVTELAEAHLKLLALYRPAARVRREDVDLLVAPAVPASTWAFLDAVGTRRAGEASAIASALLATGTALPIVVTQLHRRLRQLLGIRDRLAHGAAPGDMVRLLRLHPYRAETLARQAMHWDIPALEAALDALLEVDLASKGLSSDARRGAAPMTGPLALGLWLAERVAA